MSSVNRPRLWPGALRTAGFAAATGVLLGTFGPFGTFESMTTFGRYAFWITCLLVGTCIHLPAYKLGEIIGQARGWSAWIWVPAAGLGAAVPMTFMVNGVAASLFPDGGLQDVLGLYPYVAVISVPTLAVVHLMGGWTGARKPVEPAEELVRDESPASETGLDALLPASSELAPLEPSRLLGSIPPRLGRDILCLQMEDHYVRVHTAVGDAMVLGRMADFEAELYGRIDGLRVHRSWWVARAAVTGWTRQDKTLTLQLSNGLRVPVARDRQTEIRKAGWVS